MKKILTLLLLFCFLISCERKESNFSEEMIEKLAFHDEGKNASVTVNLYSIIELYIRTNEDGIFVTNGELLYQSYKMYYQKNYKTYKEFLETVLNEDYVFDASNQKIILLENFKLNPKTEKEYDSLGFDRFLKKYSKPSLGENENEDELNNLIIQPDEFSTISYLLYLNGYDIRVDDIHPRYLIIKREDLFK
ncbi:hypothetical protein IRZ71_02580 [Flavobacterium sp. ANB]|uniref:hypothetical protein n=1 Tax=unclassified Flavobacterium TaxID=196869 RepID=UPI0012B870C9|nr:MULTISPECIES: hypothetical protein [unclassified Flavobacterium]MBF4515206.1 hypothetical protein [Flavobacterium sp. ANB]MTD70118.1 hypothetical protein [Flavobacterium sp. LC2016-13]